MQITHPLKRPMLRTAAAAVYTGVNKSTLEKLRVRGTGSTFVRVGRTVLYDPDDLDRWLASNKRLSTASSTSEVGNA